MNLWAIARTQLELSDEDFYDMTPKQFQALSQAHEHKTQHKELLFAQLTAAVINYSMNRPKESVTVQDLMPSMWDSKPTPKRRSRKKVADDLRNIALYYQKIQNAK